MHPFCIKALCPLPFAISIPRDGVVLYLFLANSAVAASAAFTTPPTAGEQICSKVAYWQRTLCQNDTFFITN